jgi:hypothetical protein
VYKWDKQKIVRPSTSSDAHLAPVAQDKMKVRLAAQVMSHNVGASPNSFALTALTSLFAIRSKETYMNAINALVVV